jgi:hypothetical protein
VPFCTSNDVNLPIANQIHYLIALPHSFGTRGERQFGLQPSIAPASKRTSFRIGNYQSSADEAALVI